MLGLGTSLITASGFVSLEEQLRSAFEKRVVADGGTLENGACLVSALKELI